MVRSDGKKILNERYLNFIKYDYIETLDRDTFQLVLDNIDYQYNNNKMDLSKKTIPRHKEARAFMILLWITGARPVELLKMYRDDIVKTVNEIFVTIPGAKGGKRRSMTLPYRDKFVREVWLYAATGPSIMLLFPKIRSRKKRSDITYTKITVDPETGEKTKVRVPIGKTYDILSQDVNYYFKKWVDPIIEISPYFFRHSRFTVVADTKGFDYKDIMKMKGARSIKSVEKYVHASKTRQNAWKKVLVK